jgi:lactate dehydrogenase-like 2-hydroxyacid dehydrogenase
MDEKKFKVYCTFKFNWDISAFENIDLKVNPGNSLPREDLLRDIKGCHGLICNPRSCKIDAEALDAAGEQLIVISTPSTGYDHIDVEECTRRNILVGYLSHTFTGKLNF